MSEHITLHDFPVEQGYSVSPNKVRGGDLFLKKGYSWQMGEAICFEEIYEGAVLEDELMIRACQGQGSLRNAFSSNLKIVNLKIFPNQEGIYT